MDVRQLKYFAQIVESGSLSKASRQLHIVQSALSQQMARLEDEVGKSLLVRSARGVVPTANGEALYHHAKFVLRQIEEAVLVGRQEFGSVQGRVALGLAPSTASVLGLPIVRHLKENYPGILLNVVVGLPGHLEERARNGLLDIAVLFTRTAASEMVFEDLLDEDVFVILAGDSDLVPAGQTSLTIAEAARLPLVLSSPYHNLRRRIELEFERAGLSVNVVAEIDSLELVMRYAAEGGGGTIQPMAATQAYSAQAGWRCLPISDATLSRPNYLYALPVQKLSAAASIARGELKRVVCRLVRACTWQGVHLAGPGLSTLGTEP